MASIGKTLLPKQIHVSLQSVRHSINTFIRKEVNPLLSSKTLLLDAGSGRIEEQRLRENFLSQGAILETLDLFPGEGVDFVGNVAATEFENNRYDVIVCTQVLEHVEEPDTVCRELFRIAKPGGHVLITAPQSAYLHNLPHHFFHFTHIGLRKITEDAGFTVEKMESQGGHFMNLAVNLHYTCKVLQSFATTPFRKIILWPVLMLCRVSFGFIIKLLLLWLDRLFPFEGNTQGWNCLCYKPTE